MSQLLKSLLVGGVFATVVLASSIYLKFPFQGNWILTRGYNQDTHQNKDRFALDFALSECEAFDKPVLSATEGEAIKVKFSKVDYGNHVDIIDPSNNFVIRYAHLNRILVAQGQKMQIGDQLGTVGRTGKVFGTSCPEHPGTHLHFAVYQKQPDGSLVAYKPEPISGYTNLLAGNWYVSDNNSPVARLVKAEPLPQSRFYRGSSTLSGTQHEIWPQGRNSTLSWLERATVFLENLILVPGQLFAQVELALSSDEPRPNPSPDEERGEAREQIYSARAGDVNVTRLLPATLRSRLRYTWLPIARNDSERLPPPRGGVAMTSSLASSRNTLEVIPTEIIQLELVSVNIGTKLWGSEVSLNIYGDPAQGFYHPSWLTQKRPTRLHEPQVLPGGQGHFVFQIQAPAQAGNYQILFRPVYQDDAGFQWLGGDESIFRINVKIKEPAAELASAIPAQSTENFIQSQNVNLFDFSKNQSEPRSEPSERAPSQPVELDVSLGSASRSGTEITSDAPPQLALPEPVLQTQSEVPLQEDEEDEGDEESEEDEEDEENEEAETTALPDIESPVIQLQELPSKAKDLNITMRWQAEDRETPSSSASGISFFDIFVWGGASTSSADNTWTHLVKTSSTEHTFTGENKKSYKFKVQATDNAGNSSEAESEEVEIILPHVVISELQIGRASGATDEWIELYNPTDALISLAGWKLSRKTASGKTQQNLVYLFPDDASIAPKSFYLVSHPSGYTGDITSDTAYTTQSSVAADNTIILYEANGEIVDFVGFGAAGEYEGSASAPALSNDGKSIARSAGVDTDDNSADFTLQTSFNPQNSESKPEPTENYSPAAAKIADLSYKDSKLAENSVELTWKMPSDALATNNGDDNNPYFDLRYQKISNPSECRINIYWKDAVRAEDEPKPNANAGELAAFLLAGLESNTYYCAAMKTFNGDWTSRLSNIVSFKTLRSGGSIQERVTKPPEVRKGQTVELTPDNNPYYIDQEWFIPAGAKAVIKSGVVIKFGPRYRDGWFKFPTKIRVQGTFEVLGARDNPVVFTSLADDTAAGDTNGNGQASSPQPLDWGAIQIESASSEYVKIAGAEIRYGGDREGDGNDAGGVIFWREHAPLIVTDSRLEYNMTGLNAFLWPNGDAKNPAQISNSVIRGNTFSGIWSDAQAPTNVQGNFWGDPSGPAHASNPSGKGDKVTDGVDFRNWLTAEP